ncbi:MAG: LysM peptidoglycan-binding domain-containing protein [Planctomycetaceae bacterium]|nr:LysM peptidoglycan-binding domain-containing protein [Planctomycetaceae bacterium]
MRAAYTGILVVLAVAALAASGCSKIPPTRSATRAAGGSPPPVVATAGAATPKEAILDFVRAYRSGDLALFKSSVYAADWPAAEASFAFGSSFQRWHDAMEVAYGPTALQREEKRRGWGRKIYFTLLPSSDRLAHDVRITEAVDSAQAFLEDDSVTLARDWLTLPLVKINGRWLVAPTFGEEVVLNDPRLERQFPALRATGRTKLLAMAQLGPALFDKIKPAVGRRGYSAGYVLDLYEAEVTGASARRAARAAGSGGLDAPPAPLTQRPAPARGAATPPARSPAPPDDPAGAYRTYTILPSDTLTKIARKVYGESKGHRQVDIYNANREKLSNPNQLRPGTVLKIPP